MVRALFWKEWRRLRALRWSLVGIGLALPVIFAVAVKIAERGWAFQAFVGYSMQNLLLEAVPGALGLGVWPLASMVLAVQAFTADRADGTEAFLLDRAVSRAWVWAARLLASLASLGVIVLTGVLMMLAFLSAYADAMRSGRAVLLFGLAAAVLMLATFLAALGATSLVSAPLPAFLVALLLAGSPLLAGIGGALVFPYASWGGVPLAALAACVLGLGMPLASWLGDTRGEPAGRGRRWRAGAVFGATTAMAVVGFVAVAPAAVQASAPARSFSVVPPMAGTETLVTAESGSHRGTRGRRRPARVFGGPAAYVVDVATGKRKVFFPPEVQAAYWDPTGTRLAIVDNARPLGAIGPARLRFVDASGNELWPSILEPENLSVGQVVWEGDRVVVGYDGLSATRMRLDVIDPAARKATTLFNGSGFARLHGTSDGRLFLGSCELPESGDRPATREDWQKGVFSLRQLDAPGARLGPAVLERRGCAMGGYPGLSPSGRYWASRRDSSLEVVEIASGRERLLPWNGAPAWMREDTLVWFDRGDAAWTVMRMRPEQEARPWLVLEKRSFGFLKPSPGGAYLLLDSGPTPGGDGRRWLLLGDTVPGAPRQLDEFVRFPIDAVEWAGSRTLAITGPGQLVLHDVMSGENTRVFGRR